MASLFNVLKNYTTCSSTQKLPSLEGSVIFPTSTAGMGLPKNTENSCQVCEKAFSLCSGGMFIPGNKHGPVV